MPVSNAVLERLSAERDRQVSFIDELLNRVDAEGRDLVEAEQANLRATQQRIGELDAQLVPLREFEAQVGDARERAQIIQPIRHQLDGAQQLARGGGGVEYASAGAFIVDFLAARGLMTDGHGGRQPVDAGAAERVSYVLQNQTTADTPGLLPHPIVGSVVNLIDASRPFITSIGGGRSMGGIPGKTFGRPRITQHTLVGEQLTEKSELPSRKMTIGEVPFTKRTFGGAVDVSRQDIDWSSPAAWDILTRDLADVYAQETENAAADDFVAKADDVNAPTSVATADLEGLAAALYAAAGKVYANSKKLPDRIWASVDVWASIGPIIDLQLASQKSAGTSSLETFAGNMFGLPRIVVPSFPADTLIIGAASAYEVYEEAIGLLTAVEPSLLGVEVAYGGYIAMNAVAPEALAPLTTTVLPFSASSTRGSRSKSEG